MNIKYPSNHSSWLSYYVAILGNSEAQTMTDSDSIKYKGMIEDEIIRDVSITLGEIKMRAFDELFSIIPKGSDEISLIISDLKSTVTAEFGDKQKEHPSIRFYKELSLLLRDIR